MTIRHVADPDVRGLRGLHLFHFGLSNCSQRVRMALEEKGLPWTSHPVDMIRNANQRPAYLRIHPRGLVPALVHDGAIVIESLDILEHLERRFPDPPLMPDGDAERDRVRRWMHEAGAVQPAIKLLTHELLFAPTRGWRGWQLRRGRGPVDPELRRFHERFATADFGPEEVEGARDRMRAAMDTLEAGLAADRTDAPPGARWVGGDRLTLADIAWAVNLHRLDLMGFPFDGWPGVEAWHRRLRARPSFRRALVDHEPRLLTTWFRLTARSSAWAGSTRLPRSIPPGRGARTVRG